MAGVTPYEILVGPAKIYFGAVGAAFPAVAATPSAVDWTYMGRTDGQTRIRQTQAIEPIMVDQETGALKAIRTREMLVVSFGMAELTLEHYKRIINNNAITTNAGVDKVIGLYQDVQVNQFAVLVRIDSAYTAGNGQWEFPKMYQSGEPELTHTREAKTVVSAEFTSLIDDAQTLYERHGRLRMAI